MTDESHEYSAPFDIHASASSQPMAPAWTTEAVVVLRTLWAQWVLPALAQQVPVVRGRAGTYVVLDVVLVLMAYAVSGTPHLKAFYAQAVPVKTALAGVWLRDKWLSRSALSRFLADFSASSVDALRTLFYRSGDEWCERPACGRPSGSERATAHRVRRRPHGESLSPASSGGGRRSACPAAARRPPGCAGLWRAQAR